MFRVLSSTSRRQPGSDRRRRPGSGGADGGWGTGGGTSEGLRRTLGGRRRCRFVRFGRPAQVPRRRGRNRGWGSRRPLRAGGLCRGPRSRLTEEVRPLQLRGDLLDGATDVGRSPSPRADQLPTAEEENDHRRVLQPADEPRELLGLVLDSVETERDGDRVEVELAAQIGG